MVFPVTIKTGKGFKMIFDSEDIKGSFTYVERKTGEEIKITYVAHWTKYFFSDDYTLVDVEEIDAENNEEFLDSHFEKIRQMCLDDAFENSPNEEREEYCNTYNELLAMCSADAERKERGL